jgi:hypothetical protein
MSHCQGQQEPPQGSGRWLKADTGATGSLHESAHQRRGALCPLCRACHAPVTGLAKGHRLFAVKQGGGLGHVIDVGRRGDHRMHETDSTSTPI